MDDATKDLDELLELIIAEWQKSPRTSASPVERKAIEIHNRRTEKARLEREFDLLVG